MTIKKYNKLIRDKIPEIIYNTGSTPKVYIANEIEYSEHLKKKLQEEVQEFLEDPCVQELADIQEVILSIATMNGWDELLEEERVAKNVARGGFSKRFILVEVDDDRQERAPLRFYIRPRGHDDDKLGYPGKDQDGEV